MMIAQPSALATEFVGARVGLLGKACCAVALSFHEPRDSNTP